MKTRLERGKIMKNKKGFTLIELLAVIVILAIIALIAVPVVMNIIGKANKSAFKDSAYGILKAGEHYYMNELLDAEGMTDDKVFDFSNDTSDLDINGSKPTGGSMIVRKDGKISMAIHNGKHCVKKGFEEDDVTITDDIENCELLVTPKTLTDLAIGEPFETLYGSNYETLTVPVPACVTNKTKCDAGTPVAIKVNSTEIYKFYVLNDDEAKVTLIMDRNLFSQEDVSNGTHNVPWISLDDYKLAGGDEADYGTYGKNDKGPITALKVLKQRTNGWKNIPEYSYTLENDDDGLNGNNTYPLIDKDTNIGLEESPVKNVRARLPKLTELKQIRADFPANFLYENLDMSNPDVYGYWLSTNYSTGNKAWNVYYNVDVLAYSADDVKSKIGLRPVITLTK